MAVINDRVGNWAEYTVTGARQVIPVPDDIPDNWDARRIGVQMRDNDGERISVMTDD